MTDTRDILQQLADVLEARKSADPSSSYVATLYHKGQNSILKKVGEEAAELVIASKDNDPAAIIYEMADLWFHCLIVLAHHNLQPQEVLDELARRFNLSGLTEKAARTAK